MSPDKSDTRISIAVYGDGSATAWLGGGALDQVVTHVDQMIWDGDTVIVLPGDGRVVRIRAQRGLYPIPGTVLDTGGPVVGFTLTF
jgi:hypothetical protein